jgi:WD40 repeat protein
VRIWDSNSWHEVATLRGHADVVWMCEFSPGGDQIASASSDKTVIVWNPNTGRELARLEGHGAGVFACTWSPDGMRLATASRDRTVGRCRQTVKNRS